MILYCISGLGADHRAFQYLKLQNTDLVHIPWLDDPAPGEAMADYAQRMIAGFDFSTDFYLLGLSFGGMIAQEIAKLHPPKKLFLLSTIESREELPIYFRVAGKLKLHQLVPNYVLQHPHPLSGLFWAFGAEGPEAKRLLEDFVKKTPAQYTKWAMQTVLNWHNDVHGAGIRIHGTNDRILPVAADKVNYPIEGGGHMMVLDRAAEIGAFINKELAEL